MAAKDSNSISLVEVGTPPPPTESAAPAPPQLSRPRLHSMDLLRGFIMAIMALDHLREQCGQFTGRNNEYFTGPTATYNNSLFEWFIRFITTLCAPGFMYLMGVGMALLIGSRLKRNWSLLRIVRHFAVRGLVLMATERVINLFMLFLMVSMGRPVTLLAIFPGIVWVMNCLGMVMLLVGLVIVPPVVILRRQGLDTFSQALLLLATVVNFLVSGFAVHAAQGDDLETNEEWPSVNTAPSNFGQLLLRFLLYPGLLAPASNGEIMIIYNAIPWMGMATFGMAMGFLLSRDSILSHRVNGVCGAGFLACFVLVRCLGGDFGNTIGLPKGTGSDIPFIAFFTLCKYPPSLAYTLFTLGADLILLYLFGTTAASAWVERNMIVDAHARLSCSCSCTSVLLAYGHVPFFFFVVHLLVIMVIGVVVHAVSDGLPLLLVLPVWLCLLVVMVPLCVRYNTFKSKTAEESLWRLF